MIEKTNESIGFYQRIDKHMGDIQHRDQIIHGLQLIISQWQAREIQSQKWIEARKNENDMFRTAYANSTQENKQLSNRIKALEEELKNKDQWIQHIYVPSVQVH